MQPDCLVIPDNDDDNADDAKDKLDYHRDGNKHGNRQGNLPDKLLVIDNDPHRPGERPAEILPGEQPAKNKEVIIFSPPMKDYLNDKIVNKHHEQWIDNPPDIAEPGPGNRCL